MNQDQDTEAPGHGLAADLWDPHPVVDARNASSKPTLWDGAVEGHVLVKNTDNALPFKSNMKLVSLFGYSHKAPDKNTPEPAQAMFSPWSVGVQSANLTELNAGFLGNLSLTYSAIAPTEPSFLVEVLVLTDGVRSARLSMLSLPAQGKMALLFSGILRAGILL